MRHHSKVGVPIRFLLAFSMALSCAAPAMAGPQMQPMEIVKEGFESDEPSTYVTKPENSDPLDGSQFGYWGRVTNRKHSGSYGLWCNGSRNASEFKYLAWSAGWATFPLTATADYYDSDLSFWLYYPSRGTADFNSFGVKSAPEFQVGGVYDTFPLASAWVQKTFNLGNFTNGPFARRSGALSFKWRDGFVNETYPTVGEGPTIDDVLITGWKYGRVRNLAATVESGRIRLTWDRPSRAVNDSTPEERQIAYRVWAKTASSDWVELTTQRLGDTATSFVAPVPWEGQQVTLCVQSWDPGIGTGYGEAESVSASIPSGAPAATIESPQPSFVWDGQPFTITGTASDVGSGVSKVELRIKSGGLYWNGTGWQVGECWNDAQTQAAWSSWSYDFAPAQEVESQRLAITARARDAVGNLSPLVSVESYGALIVNIGLADGFMPIPGGSLLITGTAQPEEEISAVHVSVCRGGLYWNGAQWQASEAWLPASGAGTWAYQLTSLLGPAQYEPLTIKARATGHDQTTEVDSVTSADPLDPVTLTLSAPSTTAYRSVTLKGSLKDANKLPLTNKPVKLQYSYDKKKWMTIGTVTTSATGAWSRTHTPSKKTYYRAIYAGDTKYAAITSALDATLPKVYLTVPSTTTKQSRLRSYTHSGYLKPYHASGSYPVRIYRERLVNNKWKSYGYVKARASKYSSDTTKYSVKIRLPYKGKWRVRAYHPADSLNAATYSGYRTIAVK